MNTKNTHPLTLSDTVKKFIKCELITAALLVVGVLGFKAYVDYNNAPASTVSMEEIHRGVQVVIDAAEAELSQEKAAAEACVAICKKHRVVYEAALAFDTNAPQEYYNVVSPYTEAHPDEEAEIEIASELGFKLRGDAVLIAKFNAWLDGEEISSL